MSNRSRRSFQRRLARGAALAALLVSGIAVATPPPWAPAHGYRSKGAAPPPAVVVAPAPEPAPLAVEIRNGRCNRAGVGALLGGVAGGVLGSQVGEGQGKTLATIGGALIGILVGSSIGRSMDEADQGCVYSALEYAPDRRRVAWDNPENGRSYALEPLRSFTGRSGEPCREYVTETRYDGRTERVAERACRQPDGRWMRID